MLPVDPNAVPIPAPKQGFPAWAIAAIGCCCLGPVVMLPILAAILFPVFAQAREKARATACLSNTKQQAVALLMYAQDYDNRYPDSTAWMTGIQPYAKADAILHCPSLAHSGASAYGYALNKNLSRTNLDKVASPQDTAEIWDSTDPGPNVADTLQSLPNPGRHIKGNNFAFVDGHAKWWKDSIPPPSIELAR